MFILEFLWKVGYVALILGLYTVLIVSIVMVVLDMKENG